MPAGVLTAILSTSGGVATDALSDVAVGSAVAGGAVAATAAFLAVWAVHGVEADINERISEGEQARDNDIVNIAARERTAPTRIARARTVAAGDVGEIGQTIPGMAGITAAGLTTQAIYSRVLSKAMPTAKEEVDDFMPRGGFRLPRIPDLSGLGSILGKFIPTVDIHKVNAGTSNGGIARMMTHGYDFTIINCAPTARVIESIDDFFTAYGYRVDRFMTPAIDFSKNTQNNGCFYLKTAAESVCKSSVREAQLQFDAMCNAGIRFWKTDIGTATSGGGQ